MTDLMRVNYLWPLKSTAMIRAGVVCYEALFVLCARNARRSDDLPAV
jgi:hypothetical protein